MIHSVRIGASRCPALLGPLSPFASSLLVCAPIRSILLGMMVMLLRVTAVLRGVIIVLSAVIAPASMAAAPASELHISVNTAPDSEEYGWVQVQGLNSDTLLQLRASYPDIQSWQGMFSVQLRPQSQQGEPTDIPNVVGRYEVFATGVRFIPKFRPTAGLAYHIRTNIDKHQPTQGVFVLDPASSSAESTTRVEAIYPSAKHIPENTLRLYVHFSSPMRRGQAEAKIQLLDEKDKVIHNAFVTGPLGELWDRDQRRLTLLLDPGRIKRGVAPNRKLGLAMKAGGRRTLRVEGSFLDASGYPVQAEFRKTYDIIPAVREAVSPECWIITSPAVGTREPVRIRFDRAMDSGLLTHLIGVQTSRGELAGKTEFLADETEWRFTPIRPWSDQPHSIQVAAELEDVSGNNLHAPMDVTVSGTAPSSEQVIDKQIELAFSPVLQSH